jgi:hypothetical protein
LGATSCALLGVGIARATVSGRLFRYSDGGFLMITNTGTSLPSQIIIGTKGQPTEEVGVSGPANGIFLPVLLAYAAGRPGVMVTGYSRN